MPHHGDTRYPTAGIREAVRSGSAATAHAQLPAFTCSVPAVSTGLRMPQRGEMRTDFQSREFKCAKLRVESDFADESLAFGDDE